MRSIKVKLILLKMMFGTVLIAQTGLGINTDEPDRTLEVVGTNEQYLRLQTTPIFGSETGFELMTPSWDWRVSNRYGSLNFIKSDDDFSTSSTPVRISTSGRLGIGVLTPVTRVHVDGGESLNDLTKHGYLMLGISNGYNLVFDQNRIQARNNGAQSPLNIQSHGGSTHFGPGNTYLVSGGGKVALGGVTSPARVSIEHDEYHIYMSNDEAHINDWYIGASDNSWVVGGNQLIFSPSSSSNDAILRLMDVTDNDGTVAPVTISSSTGQKLLMDGTEIDCVSGPLYFNYNSEMNTLINPSGGKVGIGTTSPVAMLDVNSTGLGLSLRRDNTTWYIYTSVTNDLFFRKENNILAYVSAAGGGAWVAISDARFKENITPIDAVMGRIMQLPIYTYSFKHDPDSNLDIGVIAQELEPLFPEAVSVNDGQYGVMYGQLSAVAIKGVQEQQAELDRLSALLDSIE